MARVGAESRGGIGHSTDDSLGLSRRLGHMTRLGPRLSPILIGRDDLLDLADRRLAEVAAGRGQLLLLAGEAGIGKSRFMDAVETKARGAGFRTAGGFLAPQDRDVPAAALLDMARTSVNVLGNCLASVVVARWEREFDDEKARANFGGYD